MLSCEGPAGRFALFARVVTCLSQASQAVQVQIQWLSPNNDSSFLVSNVPIRSSGRVPVGCRLKH